MALGATRVGGRGDGVCVCAGGGAGGGGGEGGLSALSGYVRGTDLG